MERSFCTFLSFFTTKTKRIYSIFWSLRTLLQKHRGFATRSNWQNVREGCRPSQ
jgi:hypothetical protein